MTKQEIIEKVNSFLIEKLEVESSVVRPEAELRRDMGLTSIDAVHTMLFLKQEYDIQPNEEEISSLVTLQDVYDYIEHHQNNPS